MNPLFGFAVFVVIWWVVLFAVLPFGVKTADEAGEGMISGQAPSAPVRPDMKRKMLITTGISALLFFIFYLNYVNGWFTIADLPGPDRLW
jgi:predicted secreted protein